MPSPLSPETLEQIQQIAGQIQVANQLDPEIQAELRGHMEDKIAAYMSGQEKVTEADALLLTRFHFGDPAIIKSLFQGVHHREYSVSLARRLAAAFVASTFLGTLFGVVSSIHLYSFYFFDQSIEHNAVLPPWSVNYMGLVAHAALLWAIFMSWRRRMDRHQSLWFQTCRLWVFGMAVIVWGLTYYGYLFMLSWLDTLIPFDPIRSHAAHQAMTVDPSMVVFVVCGQIIFQVVIALAWIWWCDQTPRTSKTLFYAAAGYVATNIFTKIFGLGILTLRLNPGVRLDVKWGSILTTNLPSTAVALAVYLLWYHLLRPRSTLAV